MYKRRMKRALGGFGLISWDTVLASADYRTADNSWVRPSDWASMDSPWIAQLLRVLVRNRASGTDDPSVANPNWPRGLDCYAMARSLGRGGEATALCYRLGPIWPEVLAALATQDALAETGKWATASCVDRAVADGGGAICTAHDGATQVRCYHTDGSDDTILASGPCPGGTGGMTRSRTTTYQPRKYVTAMLLPGAGKPILRGRVVGPDGAAVVGATLRLLKPGLYVPMVTKTATSDASGSFSMSPAAGEYTLNVVADGFQEVDFAPITVPASGTVEVELPLVLVAGGGTGCPAGFALDPVTGECVALPAGCPDGQVLDTLTGACVDIGSACPDGQVLDLETGECVESAEKTAWYRSPVVWVIVGGLVVGGLYLAFRKPSK